MRKVWDAIYKDLRLAFTSVSIRFLRPDVAIGHAATEATYNGGNSKRTSFPLIVLTKERGKWLIAAAQNTLTSGTPVIPVGNIRQK